jgi:hypothetical protein
MRRLSARRLDRQARHAEPLGEPRRRQDSLVRAHRRDRDGLDSVRLQVADDAAHVGEAADDRVLRLREQRRVGRAVDDAHLVPERARLLEQPQLRARSAGQDERARHQCHFR